MEVILGYPSFVDCRYDFSSADPCHVKRPRDATSLALFPATAFERGRNSSGAGGNSQYMNVSGDYRNRFERPFCHSHSADMLWYNGFA